MASSFDPLGARWPCSIRSASFLSFLFKTKQNKTKSVSLSQDDINLHSETCEMTTIHLQTLLIKAGLGFIVFFLLIFSFKLLLHSPPFLPLVCCQCFQAEIKRNSLLISGCCNKATIVCFISGYLGSSGKSNYEPVCECVFRISSFKNEQKGRELIILVYFKCVINLNDSGEGVLRGGWWCWCRGDEGRLIGGGGEEKGR